MNQLQIEKFNDEEYSSLLAYGAPTCKVVQEYYKEEYELDWISTLDSMTCAGMTFGYLAEPYTYTAV